MATSLHSSSLGLRQLGSLKAHPVACSRSRRPSRIVGWFTGGHFVRAAFEPPAVYRVGCEATRVVDFGLYNVEERNVTLFTFHAIVSFANSARRSLREPSLTDFMNSSWLLRDFFTRFSLPSDWEF